MPETKANGGRLRRRRCELGHLHRAHGSAAYAQGDTVVWGSVMGPGDVRMSGQDPAKARVQLTLKARPSQSALGPGAWVEAWVGEAVGAAVLLKEFPRTLLAVALHEVQADGSLPAAAVNAACLALLDAGIPMAGVFAGVTVAVTKEGELRLDPDHKAEAAASALLHFVFAKQGPDDKPRLVSVRTQGSLAWSVWESGVELGAAAAAKVLAFHRLALQAKYAHEENTVEDDD